MSKKLPDIKNEFSEWYIEVIAQAELADHAPVRGCMVIRPYGYAIWEQIQKILDQKIKDTGHHNAAFPLLIPQSFLQKEAEHVAGFAPELAVVTHAGGKELEEPLVVRPTSETIIHYMFAQWIRSWRDLPMKINQWCSVMRWEMRTRPFLRTSEFWWQEGHTAHETYEEAEEEARLMLREYVDLIENYLAIPVVAAQKPESEKFAGADKTFTMEGLMQDGRALQMGTSHMISQSFAKAFNMTFQDRTGNVAYPYLTSWGVTTRLIGGLIMTHGDEKGLILPPRIAPIQVVIIPIFKTNTHQEVSDYCKKVTNFLKAHNIRAYFDADDQTTSGAKLYMWELKGVPVRLEIGPRDVEKNAVVLSDRIEGNKEIVTFGNLIPAVHCRLEETQKKLFEKALTRRSLMWHKKATLAEIAPELEAYNGFYQTGWCGREECEKEIKGLKATIRCELSENSFDTCCNCDQESSKDILLAKAY